MTRKQYRTYWQKLDHRLTDSNRYASKTKIWRRRGEAIVIDLRYGRRPTRDFGRSRQLHVYWHPDEGAVVCEYHVEKLSPRIIARGFDAIFLAEDYHHARISSEMGLDLLLI